MQVQFYIKLAGFNVCYSKFRPHDVLEGTCLWSFHMLVMVTQQDGRKKRTVKRLCVTKVAWLLLACCVVIFTWHNCFLVFYEKICWKESEVWRKVFSNKIIVTLVTQGLPSSFLFRPVALIHYYTLTGRHLKETVLWPNFTLSEIGKQNI